MAELALQVNYVLQKRNTDQMKGYEIKQQILQNNKYLYTALLFTTCALFS